MHHVLLCFTSLDSLASCDALPSPDYTEIVPILANLDIERLKRAHGAQCPITISLQTCHHFPLTPSPPKTKKIMKSNQLKEKKKKKKPISVFFKISSKTKGGEKKSR